MNDSMKMSLVLIAALVIGNVVLVGMLISTKAKLAEYANTRAVESGNLKTGDHVEFSSGRRPVKQVFAFLNYDCASCEATIPAWNEIGGNVKDFMVFSLGSADQQPTGGFADDSFKSSINNMANDTELTERFKIHGFPTTVVLDEEDKVLFAFTGELTAEHVAVIIALMNN